MRKYLPLLLLALGGCAHMSIAHAPLDELAEMATMGAERTLRDEMHPIRGKRRVLIFALDGVGRDVLYGMIRDGRMPHVSALLGAAQGNGVYEHGYAAPDVLSVLPSYTIAGWSAIFTGEPPSRDGIAGDEWFARDTRTLHAPVPVSVKSREDALALYTDEYLSKLIRVPTLYEKLPPVRMYVGANPVFRGADVLSVPDVSDLGDLVGATIAAALHGDFERDARVDREMDESVVGSVRKTIEAHGLADVQTVYFNGIDLTTHYAEHPLEAQRRYLEVNTDSLIGKVLDVYREHGALDSTTVLFIADHGHTPIPDDERHSLGTDPEKDPPAVLRHAGFRVRPFSLNADGDYQAVLAYTGFFAYVYLADRSTCPREGQKCDWVRPPRLEEDVLPVARAFYRAGQTGEGASKLKGALDLIFVRTPARYDGKSEVAVYDGKGLVPIREYLKRHPRPDLPRLAERMEQLMIGPYGSYAGDVVLLAKAGMERPISERFHFGAPEHSEHGSPSAQDSRVPLLVIDPLRSGSEIRAMVRQVLGEEASQLDFTPLVERLVEEGS